MKRLALIIMLTIFSAACAGSPKGDSASGTQILGAWTITANEVGSNPSMFSVSLVASHCSVATPVGTFTVEGPNCFIADDNTGQGSISGTGQFFYPPQGVLVVSSTNPIPSDSTAAINLLFVEADRYGDVAVFDGNGSVSNGAITGTWACDPGTPVCTGVGGTFSGSQN